MIKAKVVIYLKDHTLFSVEGGIKYKIKSPRKDEDEQGYNEIKAVLSDKAKAIDIIRRTAQNCGQSVRVIKSGLSGKDSSLFNYSERLEDFINNDEVTVKHVKKNSDIKSFERFACIGVLRSVFNYNADIELDCTVEIRSRFDDSSEKPWFSALMLSQVIEGFDDMLFGSGGENPVYSGDDSFFEILMIWYFRQLLENAFYKGYYKDYVRNEYFDDRLRGAIDIPRTIRKDPYFKTGRIAYSRRELTIDNPLNRLILCTWDFLKRKYPTTIEDIASQGSQLDTDIRILANELGNKSYDVSRCINENRFPIAKPYYFEYEKLRKLCLMLLWEEGKAADIYTGSDSPSRGLLFYISDLWELYLQKHLPMQECLTTQEVLDIKKDIKVFNKEEQAAIDGWKGLNKPDYFKTLRPDYVYKFNEGKDKGKTFFILDAKFRNFYDQDTQNEITYKMKKYRMFFSMRDYDIRINILNGGFVFPYVLKKQQIKKSIRENMGSGNEAFFINVPSTEELSFYEWYGQFEENVKRCMERLEKSLVTNKKRLSSEVNDDYIAKCLGIKYNSGTNNNNTDPASA